MDDPELARWRAQRMNQMRGGLPGGGPSGQSAEQIEQQRKKQEAMKEQRRVMLRQILSTGASEKLANIRLVKPDRAEQVENYVINAARGGRLPGKVSEAQLQDLLREVSEQSQNRTKVTIMRRKSAFDDEDDIDDEEF